MIELARGIRIESVRAWHIEKVVGQASKSMKRTVSEYHLHTLRVIKPTENPEITAGITKVKLYRMTRIITLYLARPTIRITPRSKLLLSTLSISKE
jgi:hypothetical protein